MAGTVWQAAKQMEEIVMLIQELTESFVIMDKTTRSDGYGGVETTWIEGAKVDAVVEEMNSTGALIAQALTEQKTYVVVTKRNVVFRHDDVIKRERDGKVFRITTDADDTKTPPSSTLDMRKCEAIEWSIPTGGVDANVNG